MEGKQAVDPQEINKSPEVMKDAQEEIGKLDVLVCGICHDVFHYMEQFQEHRQPGKCSGFSVVRENYKHEPKSQVWAFMLWKNAQFKKAKEGESVPTSWTIYQRWCRLDPEEKETWVVAGQNIQSFTKISTAKIQEIKNKVQSVTKNKITKPVMPVSKSNVDDDSLEEGEIHKEDMDTDEAVPDKTKKSNANDLVKKVGVKSVQHNNDVTIGSSAKKSPESKKALRTLKNENTEETTIQKILSKRFNQKKRCIEYLVKWENLNETENTWEPRIHFDKCKGLLEEFDKIFNKTKLQLQKTQVRTGDSKPEKDSVANDSKTPSTPGSRPQRTSKQKALNQVKVWCGDISESDEASGKRKSFSDYDDDSSDSFEKKIKLEEEESDSSEDEKPSVTIKRIVKTPNSVNGVAKKSPEGTLPTTQRVVRVSQKQLPSLSSGVYIMSKTEGIIKLDSSAPPAGSPLLKVGPKIGQTHVKMVKKDTSPTGNITKPVPKLVKNTDGKPITSTPKPVTKVTAQRKTSPTVPSPAKPPIKPAEPNPEEKSDKDLKPKPMDEDSDGLEELDFPIDLPLPAPDSPPGEFILCPLTGKILGQSEEINDPDEAMENASLDSLVKLAAAELPDVDLDNNVADIKEENESKPIEKLPVIQTSSVSAVSIKSGVTNTIVNAAPPTTPIERQTIATTVTDLEAAIKPSAIEKSTSNIINTPESATPTKTKSATGTSILNAALTNARVGQSPTKLGTPKKLLSAPSTVRQKVTVNRTPINRPVQPRPSPTSTIIHKISPSRNKQVLPRSMNNEPPVLKRTSNVTTYKPANVARRIGNTTIYKTEKSSPTTNKMQSAIPATTTIISTTQPTLVQASPSPTVISMPLLTTDADEEPSTSTDADAPLNEIESLPGLATDNGLADLSTFSLPESETPLLITGDDGTIYQVAGQNEEGQTILISEGPDGQQQCVIVSSENSTEESPVLIADNTADADTEQIEQTVMINAQSEDAEADGAEESQVVAQIIKADPPSPGGTRKVVLMLPDGNLMMTDVTAEQYAALELDK